MLTQGDEEDPGPQPEPEAAEMSPVPSMTIRVIAENEPIPEEINRTFCGHFSVGTYGKKSTQKYGISSSIIRNTMKYHGFLGVKIENLANHLHFWFFWTSAYSHWRSCKLLVNSN